MDKYYYTKPTIIYESEFISLNEYQRFLSERYSNVDQETIQNFTSSIKLGVSELLECLRESGEDNPIIIGVLPISNSEGQTDPLFAFKTDKARFLFSKHRECVESYHGVDFCSEQVDLHE